MNHTEEHDYDSRGINGMTRERGDSSITEEFRLKTGISKEDGKRNDEVSTEERRDNRKYSGSSEEERDCTGTELEQSLEIEQDLQTPAEKERLIEGDIPAPVVVVEAAGAGGDDGVDDSGLPIDRGYAWVIVFSCLFSNLLCLGLQRSYGILFVEFLALFQQPVGVTAVVMAVQSGVYSISALVTQTVVLSLVSERQAMILGGICGGISVAASALAPSVVFLVFTQGLLGLANALVMGPNMVIVNKYFLKRRSFAMAVATLGGNLGSMTMPLYTQALVSYFGIRGALLVLGATYLNICVAASLLTPLHHFEARRAGKPVPDNCIPLKETACRKDDARLGSTSVLHRSLGKLVEGAPLCISTPELFLPTDEFDFEGTISVVGDNIDDDKNDCGGDGTEDKNAVNDRRKASEIERGGLLRTAPKTRTGTNGVETTVGEVARNKANKTSSHTKNCSDKVHGGVATNKMKKEEECDSNLSNERGFDDDEENNKSYLLQPSQNDTKLGICEGETSIKTSLLEPSQSESNSEQLQQQADAVQQKKQDKQQLPLPLPLPKRKLNVCFKLVAMFDFNLFKRPPFLIIICACFFAMPPCALIGMYLPALAMETGVTGQKSALLLTVFGSCGIVSRLGFGYMADKNVIKRPFLMAILLVLSCSVAMFTPLFSDFGSLAAFSATYGLFGIVYFSLMPVVVVDLVGLPSMTKTLGFLQLFQGAAMAAAHPVIGHLRDVTGTYYASFYLMAACGMMSAVVLLMTPLAVRHDDVRRERQQESKSKV